MTQKELIKAMVAQIPNPYTRGDWYTATLPNGQACEIMKTSGRGRASGISFLHILKPVKVNVKTPDGEILSTRDDFLYFRANLNTFELKEY